MSNKDLQRLTKCVSYIGQPVSHPRARSRHPSHVAQKVNITSHCSLYISVHDHEYFAELFFRPKGSDCIARLMSLALSTALRLRRSAISSLS